MLNQLQITRPSRSNTFVRRLMVAVPAAALLTLTPVGTAHADDSLDHLRQVMKEHSPVQMAPVVTDWVESRLVIETHAASVRAALADIATR